MKNVITAAAVHKQYEEGVRAFQKQLSDATLRVRFGQEADVFFRACALGMWHQDGGALSPVHVEYYNAIYTRGNPVPSILYWELSMAVADYPGFRAPDFFARMRACDKISGTGYARRFIELVKLMSLLFGAADGQVSQKEAAFVQKMADTLSALCEGDGIKKGPDELHPMDFVTEPASGGGVAKAAPGVTEQKAEKQDQPEAEPEPEPTVEELLAQLDELCGLEKVKADVKSLINLVKVRKLREEHDLPIPPMSLHLVFMGNPGTGKTTVARLLAKIYHAIGVLSKGQLVEVDRSGLVAGFVGQTAIKANEVIQKAIGGVLFIDEAYALVNQDNANDFGHEAVEVLLKNMEDHRKDLIVIVAGYTELMGKFIHSNPGLESRFNKYFYFDDYNGEELMAIFRSMCKRNGYVLSADGEAYAAKTLNELYEERDENFGNARDVRNFLEKGIARQANRVAQMESVTREQLMELTEIDLTELEEVEEKTEQAEV